MGSLGASSRARLAPRGAPRAGLLAAASALAAGAASGGAGPREIAARGVELRRFDPRTGRLELAVSAERASAREGRAELSGLELVRYDEEGRPLVEAAARSGELVAGRALVLRRGVSAGWRGRSASARFRARRALWDEDSQSLSSADAVTVTLEEPGSRCAGRAPSAGAELGGRGFTIRAAEDRAELPGEVTLFYARTIRRTHDARTELLEGARGRSAWRISADGGCVLTGLSGDEAAVRLEGPLRARSRRASVTADAAELRLRPTPSGPAAEAVWLAGHVRGRARGTALGLPLGGPVRFRAARAELDAAKGRLLLEGTPGEPAALSSPAGLIRGVRLELEPGRLSSDGGARSVMEIGGRR